MRAGGWQQPSGLLERLRYYSHSGFLIRRHRALRRLEFKTASVLHPLVLLLGAYVLLLLGADEITKFWFQSLRFWMDRLALPGGVGLRVKSLGGPLSYGVPVLDHIATMPSRALLLDVVLLTSTVMALSFLVLRRRFLPLAYFTWTVAVVQLITCAFLWNTPERYSHTVATHVASGFEAVLILLFMVPLLLSFSFYAFDHGLLKKAAGTGVVLVGLILVAPYQYLAHMVLIDHFTLVVMPPLFALFGLIFDIAVFVSLYAWIVSWEP